MFLGVYTCQNMLYTHRKGYYVFYLYVGELHFPVRFKPMQTSTVLYRTPHTYYIGQVQEFYIGVS